MELVVNFSGGKDSCAMLAWLCQDKPEVKKHVVLADTGWEHEGVVEWCTEMVNKITARTNHAPLKLHVVRNPNKDFFGMVRHRKMFPAPAQRQCTSDLKRGPIQKWIRNNIKDTTIVSAMGLRAEESAARAKKRPLSRNKSMTNSKRTVWDWLPIQDWTEVEVRRYLRELQIPLHPIYNYLSRFSCQVCIFAGARELAAIERHNPSAIAKISALEEEIGFTLKPEGSVKNIIKSYNESEVW
jgi:3'-phosphoadenosine 5'-phosphosulfate sulfotransferase (PAPS reductase)/FAD synthetase